MIVPLIPAYHLCINVRLIKECGSRWLCASNRADHSESGLLARNASTISSVTRARALWCLPTMSARTLMKGGSTEMITSGEFSLLAAFVQHPHRPLSRERLIELARGPGSDTDSRSMDVQVSRVRKLVEPDPSRPRYIQTVWGYGYVFVPDGTPRSR